MYQKIYTSNFKKQLRSIIRGGQNFETEIIDVIEKISKRIPLDSKFRNHKLRGELFGLYECHIRPDLLMIYRINEFIGTVTFVEIGSHSKLFG